MSPVWSVARAAIAIAAVGIAVIAVASPGAAAPRRRVLRECHAEADACGDADHECHRAAAQCYAGVGGTGDDVASAKQHSAVHSIACRAAARSAETDVAEEACPWPNARHLVGLTDVRAVRWLHDSVVMGSNGDCATFDMSQGLPDATLTGPLDLGDVPSAYIDTEELERRSGPQPFSVTNNPRGSYCVTDFVDPTGQYALRMQLHATMNANQQQTVAVYIVDMETGVSREAANFFRYRNRRSRGGTVIVQQQTAGDDSGSSFRFGNYDGDLRSHELYAPAGTFFRLFTATGDHDDDYFNLPDVTVGGTVELQESPYGPSLWESYGGPDGERDGERDGEHDNEHDGEPGHAEQDDDLHGSWYNSGSDSGFYMDWPSEDDEMIGECHCEPGAQVGVRRTDRPRHLRQMETCDTVARQCGDDHSCHHEAARCYSRSEHPVSDHLAFAHGLLCRGHARAAAGGEEDTDAERACLWTDPSNFDFIHEEAARRLRAADFVNLDCDNTDDGSPWDDDYDTDYRDVTRAYRRPSGRVRARELFVDSSWSIDGSDAAEYYYGSHGPDVYSNIFRPPLDPPIIPERAYGAGPGAGHYGDVEHFTYEVNTRAWCVLQFSDPLNTGGVIVKSRGHMSSDDAEVVVMVVDPGQSSCDDDFTMYFHGCGDRVRVIAHYFGSDNDGKWEGNFYAAPGEIIRMAAYNTDDHATNYFYGYTQTCTCEQTYWCSNQDFIRDDVIYLTELDDVVAPYPCPPWRRHAITGACDEADYVFAVENNVDFDAARFSNPQAPWNEPGDDDDYVPYEESQAYVGHFWSLGSAEERNLRKCFDPRVDNLRREPPFHHQLESEEGDGCMFC